MSSLQPVPSPPSLCSVSPGTALPEQKGKALHQQLSGMGEVKRKLYSSPYTYHLLDMEKNNCWMQNHHHAGHQALEEEREVAAMKNLWSQALY